MVQSGKMQVEAALLFETVEQIYARVFRTLKPRTPLPRISIRFRKYASANSRIRLASGHLEADISDLLEGAPAPIHEALASILIAKLLGRAPDRMALARYRRYLNRSEMRRMLHLVQQERGRKTFLPPAGRVFDLEKIFEELNAEYFHGLMAGPRLGWTLRPSRTTLGHYDPSHNAIVLSNLLDSERAPRRLVRYILFHEMLHLRYPTEHRGARRCVHTREFKEAEKQFAGYREARADLKRFVEAS
ncbi:MAG: SprT-like domain-containing protein [Bryobacteraceae bacterium]